MDFFKRRQIFVMPRFQFIFLVYSFSMAAIPLLVLNLSRRLIFNYEGGENTLLLVTALTALTLLLLFVVGIALSNRIAGPLYRLTRHLHDVAQGKTQQEVKFREKDYFKELAEAANELIRKTK